MHFENICVWREGGVRHAWMCTWCQSVWTELICVHSACNSSPATSTLCLDNVKSTVNVLCSSGHQICVLAPLAILVMSQLILVPHGLSVLFSHLQSHFTWIITTSLSFFYSILCKQLRMAVQNFVIRCKKCYASLIMLSSSFKTCLHQLNCLAQQIQSDFHKQIICSDHAEKNDKHSKNVYFYYFYYN